MSASKISHIANISVWDLFVIKYVRECVRPNVWVCVCVSTMYMQVCMVGILLSRCYCSKHLQQMNKNCELIRLYYTYTHCIFIVLIALSEHYLFKQIRNIQWTNGTLQVLNWFTQVDCYIWLCPNQLEYPLFVKTRLPCEILLFICTFGEGWESF